MGRYQARGKTGSTFVDGLVLFDQLLTKECLFVGHMQGHVFKKKREIFSRKPNER